MDTHNIKENNSGERRAGLLSVFDDILKNYSPSNYIQTDWEMQDGLYVQYSAYENNTPCVVGDARSLSLV